MCAMSFVPGMVRAMISAVCVVIFQVGDGRATGEEMRRVVSWQARARERTTRTRSKLFPDLEVQHQEVTLTQITHEHPESFFWRRRSTTCSSRAALCADQRSSANMIHEPAFINLKIRAHSLEGEVGPSRYQGNQSFTFRSQRRMMERNHNYRHDCRAVPESRGTIRHGLWPLARKSPPLPPSTVDPSSDPWPAGRSPRAWNARRGPGGRR